MSSIRADRVFFYILLALVTVLTLWLVRGFIGAVVLAITAAVVLHPMHDWFMHHMGNRKGIATALTMLSTVLLLLIPALIALWLFGNAAYLLSVNVAGEVQAREDQLTQAVMQVEQWLISTGWAERVQLEAEDITQSIRNIIAAASRASVNWLAMSTLSVADLIMPAIVFMAVLGSLLSKSDHAVDLLKKLSPLDDGIDQLFLDRMRIVTKSMMLSIVVVAIVQGLVTGLLMWLTGTPHVFGLTLLATLLAILPGGAAIIAIPVGIAHIINGDLWAGTIIIAGTLTFVSALANQVRPRMVSKDVSINRAFMLMCVLSGIAIFGLFGVVYGPLIMILFTTTLEVYLLYFRPDKPSVVASTGNALQGVVSRSADSEEELTEI